MGRFQCKSIFLNLRVHLKEMFDSFTGREFPKRGSLHNKFNKFLRKLWCLCLRAVYFWKRKVFIRAHADTSLNREKWKSKSPEFSHLNGLCNSLVLQMQSLLEWNEWNRYREFRKRSRKPLVTREVYTSQRKEWLVSKSVTEDIFLIGRSKTAVKISKITAMILTKTCTTEL